MRLAVVLAAFTLAAGCAGGPKGGVSLPLFDSCCASYVVQGPSDMTALGWHWSGEGTAKSPYHVDNLTLEGRNGTVVLLVHDPGHAYAFSRLAIVSNETGGILALAASFAISNSTIRTSQKQSLIVEAEAMGVENVTSTGGVGLELVGGHTMVTGVRSTATFQALMLSGEAEVSRSTFNSTGPAVGEAVALRNATVSLRDVVVEGALTCIAATASTFSLATSSLARCAYGVGVQPTSQGTIYGNAFGPGVGGIDASSATRWDDGAHGNHWANFTDAVKPVPPNGADHHPLPGRPCSSTSDWALPRCA